MAYVKQILVSSIDFPPENLCARPKPKEGDKLYDKYKSTKADIAEFGILNLMTVRPDGDRFVVTDGSGRLLAIKELIAGGHEKTIARYGEGINVQVDEISDIQSLARQISGNFNSRQQPSSTLAKALYRYMISCPPHMLVEEIARECGMSKDYFLTVMKLKNLNEVFAAGLDSGKITASNAYTLCKLDQTEMDEEEVAEWFGKASSQTAQEFAATVADHINEERKAKKGETVKKAPEFSPEAKMLKKDDLAVLFDRTKFAFEAEPTDYNRGRRDVILEIFQLDEKSILLQKESWDKAQEDAKKKKEERAADMKKRKEEEAIKFLKENKPDALTDSILG